MSIATLYDAIKGSEEVRAFFGPDDDTPPVVIDMTNVAEYIMSDRERSWSFKDFPNLAPPFERFWMEYRAPKDRAKDVLFAMAVVATEVADIDTDEQWRATRWVMNVRVFTANNGAAAGLLDAYWQVGYDGSLVAEQTYASAVYERNRAQSSDIPTAFHLVAPFALCLSLMHCKNVVMEGHDPPKLSRVLEKKGVKPAVRYHTLAIEPMKQVLRHEGQSEATGLKKALHICRGHFKDYSKHGLFGKYKGMYWWESHARGSADVGVVIKDYAVKQPHV